MERSLTEHAWLLHARIQVDDHAFEVNVEREAPIEVHRLPS